jgi:hypothetical protein
MASIWPYSKPKPSKLHRPPWSLHSKAQPAPPRSTVTVTLFIDPAFPDPVFWESGDQAVDSSFAQLPAGHPAIAKRPLRKL